MGEIPDDVSGAAGSRGNKLGAAAGVGSGLVAFLLTCAGALISIAATQVPAVATLACCCGFPLISEVVGLALVLGAAGMTASGADWSRIPGDDALMFGAKLGVRVGVIAGILGGLLIWVSKLLGVFVSPLIMALYYGTDIAETVIAAVGGLLVTGITGAVMGVGFAIASTVLAAGVGAAVGMMKKQA